MKYCLMILSLCILPFASQAQSVNEKIDATLKELASIELQKQKLAERLEGLKLERIQFQLEEIGNPKLLPGDELVKHAAYTLSFVPKYKQARWVAHIITPDIINGTVSRTNDFRFDSSIRNGSSEEADFFLKSESNGKIIYDGFGYDRGHLAPSADFRWSQRALSESYFYSNMSPQLPDFNRGGWGDLEDALRSYMYGNKNTLLYIVTGPVFSNDMKQISRGKNKIPIPDYFFKAAIDPKSKKAIGFIMPNAVITQPLSTFAVSIDSIEKVTGLNLFNKLPATLQDSLEKMNNALEWFPEKSSGGVEPLSQTSLPKNHFNTIVAKQYSKRNEEIHVCGTVVSSRISKAGNILINLDQPYPNTVFTIFIKKENIVNFKYKAEEALNGKVLCVKGKVIDLGDSPAMYISSESDITIQP